MTTEIELINKSYFQTIIDSNPNEHPMKILGEMYKEEMQKERPELSSIRFAQGEVYFLNSDFEAAIYKWQHPLDEELVPWAQKNIADAHMEMGLLEDAEKFYLQVKTDSEKLKSEVLLQLFSLYIQQGQNEKAVKTIKDAIQLNPDYADVTKLAQHYFEETNDWDNAVELAVNEAIRSKSVGWFDTLESYAKQQLLTNYEPKFFREVLATILDTDRYRFECLVEVLWYSYKQREYYLPWLEEINELLLNHNTEHSYRWEKLPVLFHESYSYLISGSFLIADITKLVQNHVANWLALTIDSNSLLPATAILAWNEVLPTTLPIPLIHEAERQFEISTLNRNGRQEGIELFYSIKAWAEKEGLLERLMNFTSPIVEEVHLETASPRNIRDLIKAAIEFLLEQRMELESGLIEEMNRKEEIQDCLRDVHQQLTEIEEEKVTFITNSFRSLKEKLIENVNVKLPRLLQYCSEMVKEDSDLSTIHIEINDEMNRRISHYLEKNVLYEFRRTTKEWIEECEEELQEVQRTCHDFGERINEKYQQEKIILEGDIEILNDWKRDIERLSRGLLKHETVNIMLRNNPSQLLLKGAGKLLGPIAKNKDILHSRYKNYIENADYSKITEEIIGPFITQLNLFEQSIEWDINRFFSAPMEELQQATDEVQEDMEAIQQSLSTMREKPEIYQDPLTLFEIKLHQYELMHGIH